jgi:UDP-N-acetylmuramoyl-L-alanyl-D-glutamate--2,6-diaminopimelate ligase
MIRLRDIANYLNAQMSGGNPEALVHAVSSVVTNDSRRVLPGGIFVAIRGAKFDGNRFVNEATKRGAAAILSEQPRPADFTTSDQVAWLQVADVRIALAKAAAVAHGHPSRRLELVGVTGTNGKTTTSYLIESIFNEALKGTGAKSALMGTIGYRIADQQYDASLTTPEAPEIQDFLRRAVEAGVSHAVMEVSSIALDQHRVDGLEFAAAAFTNLSQDHLDYHKSIDSYFAAKRRLFGACLGKQPRHAIINLDDPRGVELASLPGANVLSYGLSGKADITPEALEFGLAGLHFTAQTPRGRIEIASSLVGRPNAYNMLCAIGVGVALGFELEVIARGISKCPGVPGRFERVNGAGAAPMVIVDYAHTPDALTGVLKTLREMQENRKGKTGRVITVMGCGGDRDRGKRPLMGEEAARLSDLVIATSDNPRSEDPLLILNDIRVGLDRVAGKPYELIVDRREAIFRAITRASRCDLVLIAGKGHENYQIIGANKNHFDDREVAREALRRKE